MVTPKSYEVTYLDSLGKKHKEITPDIITFYQRVREQGLTVIDVVKA